MRFLLLCLFLPFTTAAWADVEGSADHPMIGRFEGSTIEAYSREEFDDYAFHAAKPPAEAATVEGVTTRIAYHLPEGVTVIEAARNFSQALEGAGFEILWDCETDACGAGDLGYALELFPLPQMSMNIFAYHYIAAHKKDEAGELYATVVVSDDMPVKLQLTVVETAAMDNSMIDAKAMQKSVMKTGRVALYGIYFDTDKAEVKPESAPTLAEMAAFLQADPALQVVIVGHTDNQGEMDYNLDLSHRRASAVRQALIDGHGIDGARLTAAGAGFLAPVAPNTTEAGRALNRRVELIAR